MKRNTTKSLVTGVFSAASLVVALSTSAGPITEIPAQAASQVVAAKADQRIDVTKAVVVQAIAQKPTVAPAVVSAIAQGSPEMAAVAALAAVMQQPNQIGEITKAAVAAAQSQAGSIVAAICEKFPTKYNVVAMAAYEAAPAAGKEILAAVAASVPAIKPLIARSAFSSVPSVIADTQGMLKAAVSAGNTTTEHYLSTTTVASAVPAYAPVALPPPTFGAPFTTPVGTPGEKSRTDTAVVNPGGGRDYAN